jgi:hypothetical protein
VDTVKNLGVLLDSKLTFNAHIKFCFNKVLKMLGFLFRIGKDFHNLRSLKIIYFAFVKSTSNIVARCGTLPNIPQLLNWKKFKRNL